MLSDLRAPSVISIPIFKSFDSSHTQVSPELEITLSQRYIMSLSEGMLAVN